MAMPDANGDGKTTAEEARAQLQKVLEINDANGDSNVSIDEFEAFHIRMSREKIVNLFQHLDAYGDGAITAVEITSPAEKIQHKQRKMKKTHASQERKLKTLRHSYTKGPCILKVHVPALRSALFS